MTRVGILSFAHVHAPAYAACLKQLPEVELVGIADDDADRGQSAARQFGTRYFATYEELLAADLDGAIITAENSKHLALTDLAAEAGVHVLCEKPIATTMAAGREMIERCRQAGVKLMICFPCRYSPSVQAVKRTLDAGQMPAGWFTDKELAGGGAVIDHTVHVMDLVHWFWDSPVKTVYAEIGQGLLWDIGIDDSGLVSFQLQNGIFGTLDTSWSRPRTYPTWGDVTLEIVGELGFLEMDMTAQMVQVYSDRDQAVSWANWGSDANLALVRDFVAVLKGERQPPITGEDGLWALQVALAAYQSAREGQPVDLPLP